MKKTKIVCTIGPASESPQVLDQLVAEGMNVARLNFSHGDHEEHLARIKNIRQAAQKAKKHIGIMLDTKGPEIRTHDMKDGLVNINKGDQIRIAMEEVEGTKEKFSITYPNLIQDVHVGSSILLDDGLINLQVTDIDQDKQEIVTKALNSGNLKNKKGVNVPGVSVNLPGITEKDRKDIIFGLENGIDFIAASFVRRPSDVLEITELLEEYDAMHVQIIPKIENQEGVDNLEEIVNVSDGLMVARGDLGVEIPAEEVPIVQKQMIKHLNSVGKPVITATQMLDSMQVNPRPTRAEASDVANAIFDGTDAIMLSGETAAGDYPVEAVRTMANIAVRTETALVGQDAYSLKQFDKSDLSEAIGQAVGHTAKNLKIKTIVAATESGHTARMISKFRPQAIILAATFSDQTAKSLSLKWGVVPTVVNKPKSTDDMFNLATQKSVEGGFVEEGDLILITAGVPVGERGTTNVMKIQMVGSKLVEGQGVGNKSIVGKAYVANSADQANVKMVKGGVLVAKTTDKDYLSAIERASAIVVEQGGLTSHAAVVGIAMGIPVVVSAKNATKLINDEEVITVDGRRGIVYRGATSAI
ncbi:Pyruvate kinase [Alloiococcus otitis]|uniref:Pyruvate kinase n=1 Tax=Alloiococcus otitis ATCC 51267 TaxID=883081 RepID=K9EC09_9LACT|nr:pyruvate kinase [Alloiococcus otitis]EKU94228.1 pyruvate kinase [Alloiococcus otitis ATCC 51267]SUU81138.1 Pyruvate kinase [Alloiococcus otitis]